MINTICIFTVTQKVLSLLSKYSDREFHGREIARLLDTSAGAANTALHSLYENNAVRRNRRGKMLFYSVNAADPAVPVLKKLVNILLLEPLVEQLKDLCNTIVLYGSCAQGNDNSLSDMDVFIVTSKPELVNNSLRDFKFEEPFSDVRIQAAIKTPVELLKSKQADKAFLDEVGKGIVLWDKKLNE
jgi:predicted nucleotidyltransferase